MSVMDIFKNVLGGSTPAPQPQQTQNTNPTVPNENTPKSDGTLGAIPKAGEGDKSPLANFADLWQKDPNAQKKNPSEPAIAIDPKKIAEAAKGMDFSSAISPEAREKAAKGDVSQLATEVAQASLAVAMQTSATLVNQALEKQAENFQKQVLPDALRKHNLSNAVREKNPIFDNPAIKPFQGALESALSAKNPTMSPEEVAAKASEFLVAMSEEVIKANGKTVTDSNTNNPSSGVVRAEQDWGKFFGVSE